MPFRPLNELPNVCAKVFCQALKLSGVPGPHPTEIKDPHRQQHFRLATSLAVVCGKLRLLLVTV